MLPKVIKKSKKRESVVSKQSSWLRAAESGMVHTLKKLGDVVKKGETIARIHSVFEDESFDVIAPDDGIIIAKTQIPLTHEGDALFHIAVFKDLQHAEEQMEYFQESSEEVLSENL